MFILYFNTNSNEIVVYFLIALIIAVFVITMLIHDKVIQDNTLRKIDYETDFYSILTNEYSINYDKLEEELIVEKIRASIRHFNPIQFKTFVSDIFLKYLESFSKTDIDIIRQLSSNESYKLIKNIVDNTKNNCYKNYIEDYENNLIQIYDYRSSEEYEEIYVLLYFTGRVFTLDSNNRLVYGNPTTAYDFKVDLKFILNSDIKNNPSAYVTPKAYCLKCGNIIKITEKGHCEYCDLDIQGGNSHWILDSFGLSSSLVLDDTN